MWDWLQQLTGVNNWADFGSTQGMFSRSLTAKWEHWGFWQQNQKSWRKRDNDNCSVPVGRKRTLQRETGVLVL